MKPFRAIVCSAAAVSALAVQAPYASATVAHETESTHRVVTSEHDLNICGDLAVFKFNIRGEFTVVASDNLFHYQDNFHGTYTVTFLDPSLGVWQSRIAEAGTATVTPGGTFVNTFVANSHEGPVRIHETIFFVAGPDGTVRVDRNSVKVVGC